MKSNILLISLLLGLCIEGLSFPDIDSYYFVYPDNGQYPSISAALDSAKAYNDSTPVIMVFTPIMPMDTVILTDAFVSVSIIGQSAYGSMNTGLSSTDIIDSSDCVLQLEKLMSFNYKNHRGIRNSKIFINDCFLDNIYNREILIGRYSIQPLQQTVLLAPCHHMTVSAHTCILQTPHGSSSPRQWPIAFIITAGVTALFLLFRMMTCLLFMIPIMTGIQ